MNFSGQITTSKNTDGSQIQLFFFPQDQQPGKCKPPFGEQSFAYTKAKGSHLLIRQIGRKVFRKDWQGHVALIRNPHYFLELEAFRSGIPANACLMKIKNQAAI